VSSKATFDRWGGVLASAVLLLVGSALPLPPRHNPNVGLDKLLHLLGHAGFTAALLAALKQDQLTLRVSGLAVLASTGYGIGTELLQEVVPGREFERGDVIAGFLGSLTGIVLYRRFSLPL
jgi:VanZ family protein